MTALGTFAVGVSIGVFVMLLISTVLDSRYEKEKNQRDDKYRDEAWKRDIEYRLGYVEEIVKRARFVWKDARRPEGEEK